MQSNDIIIAPATLAGGAIAIVRLSGEGSVELVDSIFRGVRDVKLSEAKGYTLHYGYIADGEETIDDVMVSLFRAPHSYTSEDSVEISSHGSSYIVSRIIELALSRGARMATEGEFTIRAFMAGRIDLSQAEAVSDMIASSTKAMHTLASTQMRGGYSERLSTLRSELVRLSALLELELDFSDEDVEFASRSELTSLIERLRAEIARLCDSFKVGNAIKEGVAVAIVGAPNAGKSTLLNRLLGEDRAMVSEIAGTTRDTIEDSVVIDGVKYRFIDTAGLHKSDDRLEQMGIERSHRAINEAHIIMQVVDRSTITSLSDIEIVECREDQHRVIVLNKMDLCAGDILDGEDIIAISARDGSGVTQLRNYLVRSVNLDGLYAGDVVVSNARHHAHLTASLEALTQAHLALTSGLSADLLVEDLRHTIHHIGSITGEITNDEVLGEIFSSFCIGK